MTWPIPDPSGAISRQNSESKTRGKTKRHPWAPWQIRLARKTKLEPLLRKRGYCLTTRPKQNFLIEEHKDLVIKDSFWIWPSQEMKGNAIDFLMLVECLSFDQAMRILAPDGPSPPE